MPAYSRSFETKPLSKYSFLQLTFSVYKQTNTGSPGSSGGRGWGLARGNYLEKAVISQVEVGMLITSVDSAATFSFVQPLYGLINYEAALR